MENTNKKANAKTAKEQVKEPVKEKKSCLDRVLESMTKIAPVQGGGHR